MPPIDQGNEPAASGLLETRERVAVLAGDDIPLRPRDHRRLALRGHKMPAFLPVCESLA